MFTPRTWEGKIHYRHGGGQTLATSMTGASTTTGVMFGVNAKRPIKVTMLGAHLAAGTHEVDVYFKRGSHVGSTAMEWQRIAKLPNVNAAGPNTPTALPLPIEVFVERETTTAFYIATTAQLRVENGSGGASNADVAIAQGVPVNGLFGNAGAPVVPNVELGYGVCN